MLAKFVNAREGLLVFTSVAIIDGFQAGLYVEQNNHKSYHNWVHALTSFEGGEILVEDSSGSAIFHHDGVPIKGRLLQVSKKPCYLPSGRRCDVVSWWRAASMDLGT